LCSQTSKVQKLWDKTGIDVPAEESKITGLVARTECLVSRRILDSEVLFQMQPVVKLATDPVRLGSLPRRNFHSALLAADAKKSCENPEIISLQKTEATVKMHNPENKNERLFASLKKRTQDRKSMTIKQL
jgi:hypothetical protein